MKSRSFEARNETGNTHIVIGIRHAQSVFICEAGIIHGYAPRGLLTHLACADRDAVGEACANDQEEVSGKAVRDSISTHPSS
jgi:hypothetical protein